MEKFPFTSYDFYGYLSAGGLLIAGLNFILGLHLPSTAGTIGVVGIAGWALAAYILGHAVAMLSAMIIEGWVVRGLFGNFFDNLASTRPQKKLIRFLATVFNIRELKRVHHGLKVEDEKLKSAFVEGFLEATKNPAHSTRLSNFSNLYGFCRNTTFVLLVLAGFAPFSSTVFGRDKIWLTSSLFVLALMMFLRYLKFHAAHAKEVYRAYWRVKADR